MQQVLAHPWVQKECPLEAEAIAEELTTRRRIFDADAAGRTPTSAEDLSELKGKCSQFTPDGFINSTVFRGDDSDDDEDLGHPFTERSMSPYTDPNVKDFYSILPPNIIMGAVM